MAENRRALIVANYEYTDAALRRLVAPAGDAEALAEVLEAADIGGFEVTTLINQPHYVVKREIAAMFRELRRDDLAVFYFSGHGLKDQAGKLYLATVDTDHNYPEASAVEDQFVREQMDQSRSRSQVLILDCCYSGVFAKGMVHRGDERIGTAERFKGRGQVVLAASDAMQYAFEGAEISGQGVRSVFTSTLVEGLRTGEADRDQDGHVSANELFDYVFEQVPTKMPQQTPIMSAIGAQGELIVARNPRPIIKPVPLPAGLQEAIASPDPLARLGAVEELGRLLRSGNPGLVIAAREALQGLVDDYDRRVFTRAETLLASEQQATAEAAAPPAQKPSTASTATAGTSTASAPRLVSSPSPSVPATPDAQRVNRQNWLIIGGLVAFVALALFCCLVLAIAGSTDDTGGSVHYFRLAAARA